MNELVLIGRLTKDPELRATKTGKAVVNFALAVERRHKEEGADFFSVIVWDKLAELVKQYCSKGDMVAVRGHLQSRSYEVQGQKRTATEVVAEEIKFLQNRKQENAPSPQVIEDLSHTDEELPY